MSLPIPDLVPAQHPLERLPEEWAEVLGAWGEPRYRGLQVFQWIHQRGVLDPDAMTNLPKLVMYFFACYLAYAISVPPRPYVSE